MPTTAQEADTIVRICERHGITGEKLFNVVLDLRNEVGLKSENSSVRETMEMLLNVAKHVAILRRPGFITPEGMRSYIDNRCNPPSPEVVKEEPPQPVRPSKRTEIRRAETLVFGWFLLWMLIAGVHHVMVLGNLASFFVLPFQAPWYLAFPACFAIIWVVCSPTDCAVTKWENFARANLGWPPIKGFVKHYYVKPVLRALGRGESPAQAEVGV